MGASDKELRLKYLFQALVALTAIVIVSGYIYYEPFMIRHRERLPFIVKSKLPERINRPFYPVWMQDLTNEEISAAFEAIIRAELKENYPLFEEGDQIQIETGSGSTYAGVFQGLENQNLMIKIKGKVKCIPLSELTIESRLYCDKPGRDIFADKVARKRAMAYLMAEDGEIHHDVFRSFDDNDELLGKRSDQKIDRQLGRRHTSD